MTIGHAHTRELLREINVGVVKFAWLPTRLHCANGLIRDGWVWRQQYRRVRSIGFPRYYNERIVPEQGEGDRG